ncbi:MAG: copper transporter [Mycobacteriales bacterium]
MQLVAAFEAQAGRVLGPDDPLRVALELDLHVEVRERGREQRGGAGVELVGAVRKDSDAVKAISTIDDADLPMGQGTLVLGLAQQYAGGAGQYGLAGDAKAILPEPAAKP